MIRVLKRAAGLLIVAFSAGAAFALGSATASKVLAPLEAAPPNVLTQPLVKSQGMGQATVAEVVKKASPAVVKITSVISGQTSGPPGAWSPYVFPFPDLPREEVGLGSGFIISKEGYILTNQHVIARAARISIAVTGYAKPFNATVVGEDGALDLAVLRIHAPKPLPVLPLADSRAPAVGTWVVAIGNPYGLSHTVTVGVISAEGRPIAVASSSGGTPRRYSNLLQTDAAINPGNSGGPLLNLAGQVVGINTAVSSVGQGIGFAIPIRTVHDVLGQLVAKGHVTRAWLGVESIPLDPAIASYLGVHASKGAVVESVMSGSPAQVAGVEPGDVIVALDGKPVTSASVLQDLTAGAKPGSEVTLTVERRRATLQIQVTLVERPPGL